MPIERDTTLAASTREAAMRLRRNRQEIRFVLAPLVLATILAGSAVAVAKDKPPPRQDESRKVPTGCESIGPGYAKLPGSDTCVKVSGSTRSEGAVIFGR